MSKQFEGFHIPNTTPVPDILFDELLSELTGNELKVLLYIIRRTYGFGKNADAISLSQFKKGITTQDKKVLDKGCGIEHNRTILVALASLEKKGYVTSKKRQNNAGDSDTTIYKLRFQEPPEAQEDEQVVTSGNYVVTPGNDGSYPTSPRWLPQVTTVVTPGNTQETVIQDTDSQETVIQEEGVGSGEPTAPANVYHLEEKRQKRDTDPRMKAVKIGENHEPTTPPSPSLPDDLPDTGDPGGANQAARLLEHSCGPDCPVCKKSSLGSGTPAPAQRSGSLSPNAAVQGANQEKRKGQRKSGSVPDVQPVPKCDTREIQKRINEHRGYALEEDTEIIRERKAIKTWCNLHTLEEYSFVMQGLKKDKYWGKDENYYRIGGLILLKETPGILAKRNHYPLKAAANGDVAPQQEDDDYSGFDIYKGNGKEERAAMRALYEVMEANGELI